MLSASSSCWSLDTTISSLGYAQHTSSPSNLLHTIYHTALWINDSATNTGRFGFHMAFVSWNHVLLVSSL
jgi:hypothetical protein